MNFSESTFELWSKGPGKTEADRCANAEKAVRNAIDAHEKLRGLDISVFPQGSYKARTNVRQESDVDICVRYNGAFLADYPDNKAHADFGNLDSVFTYAEFKDLVGEALFDFFGDDGVTRGNKAFDVHANTYRIDADVVATFEHRRYTGERDQDGTHTYLSGVAFIPDEGEIVKNWPVQNYDNGLKRTPVVIATINGWLGY